MSDFFDSQKAYASMNEEDREMLARINDYSESVLGEIDPQKTPISFQLDKLKPIMQEIASEKGISLEDVFIKYMDLASIVAAHKNARLKADLDEAGVNDFTM